MRATPLADVISPAALPTNNEFFVECFVRPAIQAMSLDGRSKPQVPGGRAAIWTSHGGFSFDQAASRLKADHTPRGWRQARPTCSHPQRTASEPPGEPLFQKRTQFRGGLELRYRIEFFERGRECIGQTPHGPRPELFILRLEVQVMHPPSEVLRDLEFAFDERLVDDHLR